MTLGAFSKKKENEGNRNVTLRGS